MKTYKNLYNNLCHRENLFLAHLKARKGKTKKYNLLIRQFAFINVLDYSKSPTPQQHLQQE